VQLQRVSRFTSEVDVTSRALATVLVTITRDLAVRMLLIGHSAAWRALTVEFLGSKRKTFVFIACEAEAEKAYAAMKAAGLLCRTDIGLGDPSRVSDPFSSGVQAFACGCGGANGQGECLCNRRAES
jgi:hypothetical protein